MLERLNRMRGWTIDGTDGEIGKIDDFLFDDTRWAVRYFVIDASSWLNRHVLLSALSFDRFDADRKRGHVGLTRELVQNAPDTDLRQPLSRRDEALYAEYYQYPTYWGGIGLWGTEETPRDLIRIRRTRSSDATQFSDQERHLKRVSQVLGFHIRALDGEVGHIDDFLVDNENWAIRYLLADTSNFIGGKWVLISPEWARNVDWNGLMINVDMNKEQVKKSPEYDPDKPISREYETRLYTYYHRPHYWR